MAEFTGERVVPGQVNEDLWSEHLARYAFASRYSRGRRVLDAGCGTGYGSAKLAESATTVTGLDSSPEAIAFARLNYQLPGLRFVLASCEAMPFRANTFDLVVAFEVIEHLHHQRAFLEDCARVLTHQGLFIVSSPNRVYYAESRGQSGPNPYHTHEFDAAEFADELGLVFSNVRLLFQNRVESFAFNADGAPAEVTIDRCEPTGEAHFIIAMCSFGALPEPRSFVYVPKAANVLREREQHIGLLEQELDRTKQWLSETQQERDTLLERHGELKGELESSNRWAEQLNAQLTATGQRVVQLQDELSAMSGGYEAKIAELEQDIRSKTEWALATEARLVEELRAKCDELAECVRLLQASEATVEERTVWAQETQRQREALATQLNLVRASRWLKLGRKVGLGPEIQEPQ